MKQWIEHHDGTPYNQEFPEGYIAPYDTVDTNSHPFLHILGSGVLIATSVAVITHSVDAQIGEDNQTQPNVAAEPLTESDLACDQNIEIIWPEATTTTEATRPPRLHYALSPAEYRQAAESLSPANSREQFGAALANVFEKWNIKVWFLELPPDDQPRLEALAPRFEHQPALIDSTTAVSASIALLEWLQHTPNSFLEYLRGTELVLSGNIKESGKGFNGLYDSGQGSRADRIYIDIYSTTEVGDTLTHEMMHAFHDKLCHDKPIEDQRFTQLNPHGFSYTNIADQQQVQADIGNIVTPYAATNVLEDFAETGKAVLSQTDLAEFCRATDYLTKCKKASMLAQRLGVIEPAILDYLERS